MTKEKFYSTAKYQFLKLYAAQIDHFESFRDFTFLSVRYFLVRDKMILLSAKKKTYFKFMAISKFSSPVLKATHNYYMLFLRKI